MIPAPYSDLAGLSRPSNHRLLSETTYSYAFVMQIARMDGQVVSTFPNMGRSAAVHRMRTSECVHHFAGHDEIDEIDERANMVQVTRIQTSGYENVVRVQDSRSGLDGFIAVHSTVRGPALGGLRFRRYRDPDEALADALRLSEAMTYKAAAAGLPFGGGKAVIIGDPQSDNAAGLLAEFGRAVDALDGTYITAQDVGTSADDLIQVATTTRWVAGLPKGQGGSGDPSPATAQGVFKAMQAAARVVWQSGDLRGRRVIVQGVGKVGAALVERLCEQGALVSVADADQQRAAEIARRFPGVQIVATRDCLTLECDILSPCAWGGILTESVIPDLRCRAVVGSANNQLRNDDVSTHLADRGIAYVPDFIANGGGIINIASEYGYSDADVSQGLDRIAETTERILRACYPTGRSTHEFAIRLAQAAIR